MAEKSTLRAETYRSPTSVDAERRGIQSGAKAKEDGLINKPEITEDDVKSFMKSFRAAPVETANENKITVDDVNEFMKGFSLPRETAVTAETNNVDDLSTNDPVRQLMDARSQPDYKPNQNLQDTTRGFTRDIKNIRQGVENVPAAIVGKTGENFLQGLGATGLGASEMLAGDISPSFPSADPSTWKPGGALRAAGGILGAAMSPLTATVSEAVEKPINQLTGNPEIGARAGFVANSIVPLPIANKATEGVTKSISPTVRTNNVLKEAIESSGIPLPEIVNKLKENPRLRLMDIVPDIETRAMGIAKQSGEGQGVLLKSFDDTKATAKQAVEQLYDNPLGSIGNVKTYVDDLANTAKTNAKEGFGIALKDSRPVDVIPVIQSIEKQLPLYDATGNPLVSSVAKSDVEKQLERMSLQLTDGKNVLYDAEKLHKIQSKWRKEAMTLIEEGGQSKLIGLAMMDARRKLVDAINNATGGKFKTAQKQFADDIAVRDSFSKGLNVFQNRSGEKGLLDRPEYLEAWLADASAVEKDALQKGVRVAIDQKINSVRNAARSGQAITDVGANLDKLALILGEKEAAKLSTLLKDEAKIANTNTNLFQQSATARNLSGMKAQQVREPQPMSLDLGLPIGSALLGQHPLMTGGLAAAVAGRRAVQGARKLSDKAHNKLLAEAASARGQEAINLLLDVSPSYSNLLGSALTVPSNVSNKLINSSATSNSKP
jgi:hypothetical protein